MASRFWTAGSSDEEDKSDGSGSEGSETGSDGSKSSDDDSSSGSGSGSDSDSEDSDAPKGASRFLAGSSDSDSDDDRKVVLKSNRDKRLYEVAQTADDIRKKMKINDWSSIQTLFDELNKRLDRVVKTSASVGVPRAYLRILVELEEFLNETLTNKDIKKKMSPTNAKAMNTMRQRLKKANVQYAEQLVKYNENPESTEVESEEESESSGDEGKEGREDKNEEEGEERKAQAQKKKDKLLTMDPKEITFEMISKKLREIVSTRGRRGTDKQEQVEMLTYLVTVSKGPSQKIEVLSQLVSSLFDLNPSLAGYLKTSLWKKCVLNLLEILQILQDNPHVIVDEQHDMMEERAEEPAAGVEVKVWGNLMAFLERLDVELFKSLQVIDPHSHEYMARLRDEPVFLALADKVLLYFTRVNDTKNQPKVALQICEHLYYKTDSVYTAMRKLTIAQQEAQEKTTVDEEVIEGEDGEPDENVVVPLPRDYVMDESSSTAIFRLSRLIYRLGDERTKARAMLCTIYHRAIRDDFYGARDLLLMSHLQDNVGHMDISTQIVYNRALAQLGLAAFRGGLIHEAHQCLNELYGSTRIKELLAQGIMQSKFVEKTPEQELQEKQRQMPFHMHITIDLVESVYLISAMLLEVPNMAANPMNPKKKMISKPFHKMMDVYGRQMFTGLPESVRDHVMAATRVLLRGDWQRAYALVVSLPAWNLVPRKDEVLAMLKVKLQEEALRTYLFSYACNYNSLSLTQLCSMFELPEKSVYSIVSKMMISEELQGSWDQPTRTIVMHNISASRLQELAGQLADKAGALADLNASALAYRTGGLRDNDEEGGGGRRRDRRDGGAGWEDDGQGGRRGPGGKPPQRTGNFYGARPGGRDGDNRGPGGDSRQGPGAARTAGTRTGGPLTTSNMRRTNIYGERMYGTERRFARASPATNMSTLGSVTRNVNFRDRRQQP